MRAFDTNVLVFAEIRTNPFNETARQLLGEAAEGANPWALPWPCAYEFLRVVTHPRIYYPPVPVPRALQDLGRILASPTLILLSETERHIEIFQQVIRTSGVAGNLIHDAHIAALCLEHGVSELVTGDRDFLRFPDLRVTNPFM
ncbi:MAG: PIN domain-containing protein [Acidobacteriota bacterium]|nr:PIN domain-containing protein [Acidobacteriota bacterium]